MPLPPWAWIAWSSARVPASAPSSFAMFAASPAGRPASWRADALMGADRLRPDFTLARVSRGLLQRVAADAAAHRRRHHPLRVQAAEHGPQRLAFGADQAVGGDLDLVEHQREGVLRGPHRDR